MVTILLVIMGFDLILMFTARHIRPVLKLLQPILGTVLGEIQIALGLQIIITRGA